MQNNYFFFRHLVPQLSARLRGMMLVSCFTQTRDELVMEFRNTTDKLFIRVSLGQAFSCLSFPEEFARARKNTIDIFNDALMQSVQGVVLTTNDRSFAIQFDNEWAILFKMHGNLGNALLLRESRVTEIFKKAIEQDWSVDPDQLVRQIDWSWEYFSIHRQLGRKLYPTFGPRVWEYLDAAGYQLASVEGQWQMVQSALSAMEKPRFFILERSGLPVFSLLPGDQAIEEFSDPMASVTRFFHLYHTTAGWVREQASVLSQLADRITHVERYIAETERQQRKAAESFPYGQWADLLTGGMYALGLVPGNPADEAVWASQIRNIPLDPALTMHQNAERFYVLARKTRAEADRITSLLASRREELDKLRAARQEVEGSSDLSVIRKWAGEVAADEPAETLPFHQFEFKGFRILIGKNAKANDTMMQQYTYKEDLWLHARDVPGSHVLIKHQSGKPFPRDVIERAASIAAWYSKRRNESLCPVMVTPRKYVRKKKDTPAGMVFVDKEETVMVEPKDFKV
ncbi:MAG: NFACT RNA binding domain-containing protein [Cyclobacteriaceae bacterium]|nr:NFACT RNA binding domain-containing protein [Cyclobacteriaceae bacterium]